MPFWPGYVQSHINHFDLMMYCFWGEMTLWTDEACNVQVLLVNSDCLVTWYPMISFSISNKTQLQPRAEYKNENSYLLKQIWIYFKILRSLVPSHLLSYMDLMINELLLKTSVNKIILIPPLVLMPSPTIIPTVHFVVKGCPFGLWHPGLLSIY